MPGGVECLRAARLCRLTVTAPCRLNRGHAQASGSPRRALCGAGHLDTTTSVTDRPRSLPHDRTRPDRTGAMAR